ncbi:MAG: GNAT family N-acetyltransferase [Candidatus Dormibacteria bacterium]
MRTGALPRKDGVPRLSDNHGSVSISAFRDGDEDDVRALLAELALEDQGHFSGPRISREQAAAITGPIRGHFVGENHLLIARDAGGDAVGVLWCVIYDPGTGLEAELAELFVRPEARGRGIASRLTREAVGLFRRHGVTLASVWTHENNPAALATYRRAGFLPTEHTVLTWLPSRRPDAS